MGGKDNPAGAPEPGAAPGATTGAEAQPQGVETPAPADHRAERQALGDEATDVLSGEMDSRRVEYKDLAEKFTKETMKAIKALYEDRAVKFGGQVAEFKESVFIMTLQEPARYWGEYWIYEMGQAQTFKDLIDLKEKYENKMNEFKKVVEWYLEMATKETGWIDGETFVRMTDDVNGKAINLMRLFVRGPRVLHEAAMWALGMKGAEAKQKVMKELPPVIREELPKGEGLMSYIWMIMSFLNPADRTELIKATYKKEDANELDTFLKEGNKMGVFGPDEMEDITKEITGNDSFKYTDEERKGFGELYEVQNELIKRARQNLQDTYGASNDANEMITIQRAGIFLGRLASGATVGANILVGLWRGGALNGPTELVSLLTQPYVLGGLAAYHGLGMLRKGTKLGQVLEGESIQKTRAGRRATRLLIEQRGTAAWPDWDGFFRSDNFRGAKVFGEYVASLERVDGEMPRGEELRGRYDFSGWLELKMKSNDPEDKKIDYAAIKRQYDSISGSGGPIFAEIFNAYSIGGAQAGETYEAKLESAFKKAKKAEKSK